MVGLGRDLCGSSSPTLLPKQGYLEQVVQDLVHVGLQYLQRRRLHNLPGQPVPVLRHPQREEVLPRVQMELPVLQFVPVAPCPVTGTPSLNTASSTARGYSWPPGRFLPVFLDFMRDISISSLSSCHRLCRNLPRVDHKKKNRKGESLPSHLRFFIPTAFLPPEEESYTPLTNWIGN